MSPRLRVALVLLASLVLACATGCRRRYVVHKQDPAVREGRTLYLRYCALCHGKEAQGYAADHANALGNADFLAVAGPEFLRAAITDGRPGTPMSAWGKAHGGPLGPAEVDRIVAYLRSLAKKPLIKSDPTKRGNGDPRRGAIAYAKSCPLCHGIHGEGTTRATSLAHPNFLRTVSDEYLRLTIVHGRAGTEMPGFDSFSSQTLEDLVAFLRTLDAPPTPAPSPLYEPPPGLDRLVLNPQGQKPVFTLREGRYVSSAQVAQALAEKRKLVILDARPTSDWSRNHIVGALPFPFYDIEEMAKVLPKDGTFILAYCACPHAASGHVVDELRRRKFPATAVIDEGIGFWTLKGYPTAQAAQLKVP